jgi:hypothetical protein
MRYVRPIVRLRYAILGALIGAGMAFLGGFALSWGRRDLYAYFVGAIYAAAIFSGLGAIIGDRVAFFVDRWTSPPPQAPLTIPPDVEAIARERFNAPGDAGPQDGVKRAGEVQPEE